MALARMARRIKEVRLLSLRALTLIFALGFCIDCPATQAREPDISIDIGDQNSVTFKFSGNGDYLFLRGGVVERYDLAQHRFDGRFSIPVWVDNFAINSNGTRFAYVDGEKLVVLEAPSGTLLHTLSLPDELGLSTKIFFSRDDSSLICMQLYWWKGHIQEIYIVDLASAVWFPIISSKSLGPVQAALSASGSLVIARQKIDSFDAYTYHLDYHLESRAAHTSEPSIRKTLTFDGSLYDLTLSGDGSRLLLKTRRNEGIEDAEEDVWYVLDVQTLAVIDEPWATPTSGRMSHGTWLAHRPLALYGGRDGYGVTIHEVREHGVLFARPDVDSQNVELSLDGRWVAVRYSSGRPFVDVYSLVSSGEASPARTLNQRYSGTESLAPRLVPQLLQNPTGKELAISGNGHVVAVGTSDGTVLLLDYASGRQFRKIKASGPQSLGWSRALALSQDGSKLLVSTPGNSMIWDVASGEKLQQIHGSGGWFAAFLADGVRILICGPDRCTLHDMSPGGPRTPMEFRLNIDEQDYKFLAVSLAPDEASVALALGTKGIGWMELSNDGRQRVIPTAGDAKVTAVAAFDGAQLVAGLSNGDIILIDATRGSVLKTLKTRAVDVLTRVGSGEFVVASHGESRDAKPEDTVEIELLAVSLTDFSVSSRWTENVPKVGGMQPHIASIVVSNDGRRTAWSTATGYPGFLPVGQGIVFAGSNSSPSSLVQSTDYVTRVDFDRDGNYLLVDNGAVAKLWDMRNGRVAQKFFHRASSTSGPTIVLTDDSRVIYITDDLSVRSWSVRSGVRDLATLPPILRMVYRKSEPAFIISTLSPDGSRAVFGNLLLKAMLLSLDEHGLESSASINPSVSSWMRTIHDDTISDRLLLNFGGEGLELVNASSTESIWMRNDISQYGTTELMFTADRTGIIAPTGDGLLVLEAETGETRFNFGFSTPILSDVGALGVLRATDDGTRLERLSLHDGSVLGSTNLGISAFYTDFTAVADQDGDRFLIFNDRGLAVLWEPASGSRTSLGAHPKVGITQTGQSVAFSSDGRLLAIAETDGVVSLWDVSNGPDGLRRLARLVTFLDGGWVVIGEGGRYDASDPADLDGLAWVMPNAPTKPVPLSIFYREYYEPRLLPRLLAGEAFPPIRSIAALDRTQPQVEVAAVESAGANRVNVSVEVRETGAEGVQDLKLFRDGRLVGLDETAGRPPESGQGDTWRVVFPNIVLPTSGSDSVEFSAYAFNADGVKSETHRLSYTRPEVEPNPRRAFVIVVGVNAYENPSWDLRYAAEDARTTGEIITRHITASGAFEEVYPVSLIAERGESGAITGTATRAALLAVLDVLAGEAGDQELLHPIPGAASLSKARPDDLVYLAFSGHGLSGDKGLFHLFLSDIGEGKGRTVNSALLARTLDSDLLARHLRRVDAGDFVMIVDACNAAASVEGGGFKPGPMGSRGLGQLAYDKAMRILAASQAEAVALESDQLRHGLLTFAMLHEGLAGGAADRAPTDQAIDFSELLSYGVDRVPLLYEDIRSGSFAPQGRGLTVEFTPPSGQIAAPTSAQRPSLFDFSRGEREVHLPVIAQ